MPCVCVCVCACVVCMYVCVRAYRKGMLTRVNRNSED